MKSYKNQKTGKKTSFQKLRNYGPKAILILPILLTSCVGNFQQKETKLNIYQPSTLRLEAQKPIETIDGIYTPQKTEIWHSDSRFRRLEREIYFDK